MSQAKSYFNLLKFIISMYYGNFRGACDGREDPWIFINWLYDMD